MIMANGIEKARENVRAFEFWKAAQTSESYRQLIHRGKLNRGEIAKAINCGRSAFTQNPELNKRLCSLETELRKLGVLPALSTHGKDIQNSSKLYDPSISHKVAEKGRVVVN